MIKSDEIGWPFCIFVQFKKLAGFGIFIVGLFFILFFLRWYVSMRSCVFVKFFVHVSSNLLMKFWHFHQCMTLHNKEACCFHCLHFCVFVLSSFLLYLNLYFCFYLYEAFFFFIFFIFILMDMEDNSIVGTQFFVLFILLL